ncbi:DNA adenine methylase [Clostridiisalibacter paucivorans]|uniref:DNA adenine methylase n=1 Tax=Clostridiisalibacter paucivorans TaxID=408753 RepID=UPI00047DB627|nr:DNA adenine methylase [Clostridiisalibacter paucivorans]
MLKSPISWMGGKYRLRKKIIKLIPNHKCYIEVFGGAAWVFFGKKPSIVEVYNDINKELVNLFRIIKYHPKEFMFWIEKDIVSREIFNEYKDISGKYLTDIQRAVRFYYIIKYSFGSKCDAFGYGKKKGPSNAIFDTSFVSKVRKRLNNCYIENLTFEILFEKYDSPESFFYCDPPYYQLTQYKHKFSKEDHLKLLKILKNIKGKFLLTINDHEEIKSWYKDFHITKVDVGYSIAKKSESRKKYGELIITNYNPKLINTNY